MFSKRGLEDFVAGSRDERTIRPDCPYATSQTCFVLNFVVSTVVRMNFSEGVDSEEFECSVSFVGVSFVASVLRAEPFGCALPEFSRSRQAERKATRRRGGQPFIDYSAM